MLQRNLRKKQIGFSSNAIRKISHDFLPNSCCVIDRYSSKVFCGIFSDDGNLFVTANQGDQKSLNIIIVRNNTPIIE